MSAEFMTNYPESDVSAAQAQIEEGVRKAESVKTYLLQQEAERARTPQQLGELRQMFRVARFIVAAPTAGEPRATEDVHAFYHGELLAVDMLSRLPQTGEETGRLAQRFFGAKIQRNREAFYRWLDDEAGHSGGYEDSLHHQQRHAALAEHIQSDLLHKTFNTQSTDTMLYLSFADEAAIRYADNPSQQSLFTMGFRLILKEALLPSSRENTAEALAFVDTVPSYIKPEPIDEQSTGFMLEKDTSAPSLEALSALIKDPGEFFDQLEDISFVRKNLLKAFIPLLKSFQEMDKSNPQTELAILRHLEQQLRAFNDRNHLIQPDDSLTVSGEFFGLLADSEKGAFKHFTNMSEVRGDFGGLYVLEAPSHKTLLRHIDSQESSDEEIKATVLTPAIRINNPTFVHYYESQGTQIEHFQNLIIDIPLIYKAVDIYRQLPLTLEDADES